MTVDAGDVEIDYTNHRGERAMRRVRPLRFLHGANEWHKEPCHQCLALDLEKMEPRYFALQGVHLWRELSVAPSVGAFAACSLSRDPQVRIDELLQANTLYQQDFRDAVRAGRMVEQRAKFWQSQYESKERQLERAQAENASLVAVIDRLNAHIAGSLPSLFDTL
jgi:predicted DNA-binding transcriptional regulator YafY